MNSLRDILRWVPGLVPLRFTRPGHEHHCGRGMTPGVGIWRCVKCGTGFFPQRLLCARCHADSFEPDRVHEAVVEEISIIRHMLGQDRLAAAPHCQRAHR